MRDVDILGREYDWFAVDGEGRVGLFSTAGGGVAPASIRHDESYFEATRALLEALLAGPATTRARRAPKVRAGLRNDWRLFAERGGFGFDSGLAGGPYRRVSVPAEAVEFSGFPEASRAVLGRIRFPELRFGDVRRIPPAMVRGR